MEHEKVRDVFMTRNYLLFSDITGNRVIKKSNVEKIKKSIKEKYLKIPIAVNDKYQIVDGQHRFIALRELQLEIYYSIYPGYGLEEARILNLVSQRWDLSDYVYSYASQGYIEYIKFREFQKEFPEFNTKKTLMILLQIASQKTNSVETLQFQNGEFKIPDLEKSRNIAMQLRDFKDHNKNILKNASFIGVYIRLQRNPDYDHSRMMERLSANPYSLKECTSAEKYEIQFNELYNYNMKKNITILFDGTKQHL